jgi:opacity protein-like surface antigen
MRRKLMMMAFAMALVVGLASTVSAQEAEVQTPVATAQRTRLLTTAGTMHLGGQLDFTYQNKGYDIWNGEDNFNDTGYELAIRTNFGYFIINNLELMGTFLLGMAGGDPHRGDPKSVGFNLGVRYVINLGILNPYFGVSLGMEFLIPPYGETAKYFTFTGGPGILIALNQHVAINLGILMSYQIGLKEVADRFSIPIVLGVDGFF